jgi:hypothetical protein
MREAIRWRLAASRFRPSDEQTRYGAIAKGGCETISSSRSLTLSRYIADNYEKVVYTMKDFFDEQKK